MLIQQAFLLGILFIIGTHQSSYYGDGNAYVDPSPSSPFSSWNWRLPDIFASESRRIFDDERDVEEVADKDREREPLAPDYRDPENKRRAEKPIPEQPQPTPFDSSLIPGGVVDVEANNFDFPDFGFSSFGGRPGGGLFGLGGFFGAPEAKPWWKGENVCIEREESTDDDEQAESKQNDTEVEKAPNFFSTSISLSNCQQSPSKYECVTKINNHGVVKTFTVRYKCCYGYKRVEDSAGCTKKIVLQPLLTTVEEVGGHEYAKMVRNLGLEENFNKDNMTIFMPTDEALNIHSDEMLELNQVMSERKRRQVKNPVPSKELVLNHALSGFVELSELANEDSLYSFSDNNNLIRINTYPTRSYGKMVTANCARVTKSDNFAANGIVHVIDGVLTPVSQTIVEIINNHPQLSNLRKALEKTDLLKNFKSGEHYTIFAPTDDAFNKLESSTREKILNGDACSSTILKHHIVRHTVCSCAILGNATTHNVYGEVLNLQRTEDDNLFFERDAKIIKTDIIATNGVIHLVDLVVIPDSALYISQALKNENFTKFQDLIEKAGLTEEIDSMKNLTLFAPSDKAFSNPETQKMLEEIKDDQSKLKELIFYHAVQGKMESCNMNNNIMLKSNYQDKPLRLNLYSTLPVFTNIINRATVNCARLTGYDEKTCGSVIHEVNSVLTPPSKNLLEAINSDESYSTFSKLLKDTEVESNLKSTTEALTILAPTNEAFEKFDAAELEKLMNDKERAIALLKNHILPEVLCCTGIGPQTWGFNSMVPTLSRQQHSYGRVGEDIRFGTALVKECDNVASNGVIHKINKVLLPQQPRSSGFEFFLFNL